MPNDASVLAFSWHLKCHFERRNPLFWHFKSNKRTKTKRKNYIFDFLKCLHVFYSVFSIRCKICKICRSLTLRQKVAVLLTAVFERFHAFHCLICQSWTWGNHLFSNNSKAAFRPTCICNLAFAHKGFTFNSFSIVFSVITFQGIVFLESLLKRWFPQVQLWQIKQWKAWNLSKTAVIKSETFCCTVCLKKSGSVNFKVKFYNKEKIFQNNFYTVR